MTQSSNQDTLRKLANAIQNADTPYDAQKILDQAINSAKAEELKWIKSTFPNTQSGEFGVKVDRIIQGLHDYIDDRLASLKEDNVSKQDQPIESLSTDRQVEAFMAWLYAGSENGEFPDKEVTEREVKELLDSAKAEAVEKYRGFIGSRADKYGGDWQDLDRAISEDLATLNKQEEK